jgi:predicted nucleic acid-binding Zn finger protein
MATKIPINIKEKHNKNPFCSGTHMSLLIPLKGKWNQSHIHSLQAAVKNP